VITHFALWVEDVDELAEKLKSAGVTLTKEVTESVIKSEPPVPIKVAFFNGPAGEEIELFEERV
jgi:catechol 2,3-dioxygenase-like lactoylglutathione lyase family enzyme